MNYAARGCRLPKSDDHDAVAKKKKTKIQNKSNRSDAANAAATALRFNWPELGNATRLSFARSRACGLAIAIHRTRRGWFVKRAGNEWRMVSQSLSQDDETDPLCATRGDGRGRVEFCGEDEIVLGSS